LQLRRSKAAPDCLLASFPEFALGLTKKTVYSTSQQIAGCASFHRSMVGG
jgi:hypothetical protein